MPILHKGLQVDQKCIQTTLDFSMFKNISSSHILKYKHMTPTISTLNTTFPLHTTTQNSPLKVSQRAALNVRMEMTLFTWESHLC